MFSEPRKMKRKVVKSFPILLALFSAQVLLTVGAGDVDRRIVHEQVQDDGENEEMKCVCDGGCEHLRESDCPWGLTLDVCGCCFLCARGENEPCAGAHGTCAVGLRCQLNPLKTSQMTKEGTCTRCIGNDSALEVVKRFGCNVHGGKCICEERHFGCPDEEMFLFDTEDSCRSTTAFLIDRKDLEPQSPSVSATDGCRNAHCPEVKECPPDSYRHPILMDSSQGEVCCPPLQHCLCNPGLICPSPPPCSNGLLTSTVTSQTGKPGFCCPTYECARDHQNGTTEIGMESGQDCFMNGERYDSGQSWAHHEDCTECDCHNGVVSCQPIQCDIHPECTVVKPLPGSCCPVCAGCMTNSGKVHNNSDVWDEDPCTTCECSEGRIKCHAVMCQTTCLNPVPMERECCPRCDDEPECPFMECEDLECPNGFRLTQTGCPTCECTPCQSMAECTKECEFGFETNEEGCPECRCHQGEVGIHVSHHQIQERSRPGTNSTIRSQSCDTFTLDGTSHTDGEEWLENCRRCVCRNGSEMCSLISCSPPKCDHPVLYPGSCCPMCPGQFVEQHYFEDDVSSVCHGSSDGIQHIEGELWKLGGCLTCTCDNGQVLCRAPECLPTPCPQSLMESEGDCCMKCHNNTVNVLSDKNTITNSTDSKLNCFSDDSQKVYGDGEMWKVGPCQSCICQDGQVLCFSEGKCPTLECERPVLAKNQCCPICLDEKTVQEIAGVPTIITGTDEIDQSSTTSRRIITTEFGSKSPRKTSNEEINFDKNESSWSVGLEENHVVLISVFLCVSFLSIVFIIRIYYYRRQARLAKEIPFHCSSSSTTTPPITPECFYKYENCTTLSEQKTPLCHNSHKNNEPRNTSLILNTNKV